MVTWPDVKSVSPGNEACFHVILEVERPSDEEELCGSFEGSPVWAHLSCCTGGPFRGLGGHCSKIRSGLPYGFPPVAEIQRSAASHSAGRVRNSRAKLRAEHLQEKNEK